MAPAEWNKQQIALRLAVVFVVTAISLHVGKFLFDALVSWQILSHCIEFRSTHDMSLYSPEDVKLISDFCFKYGSNLGPPKVEFPLEELF